MKTYKTGIVKYPGIQRDTYIALGHIMNVYIHGETVACPNMIIVEDAMGFVHVVNKDILEALDE